MTGGLLRYALLAYAPPKDTERATRPIPGSLAGLFLIEAGNLDGRFRGA
jgi:hypothetical protein